uniref:RNASEK-C17orf49 readthrough (Non-protein coding) n=1 Tax=Syphacia muris TaxID=451379 RepID=A0A0N5AYV1_9BILA
MCLKGTVVIAANKRHEICALHQSGNIILQEKVLMRCINRTMERVVDITEVIASVILDDNLKRSQNQSIPGFSELISLDVLTSNECNPNELIVPALSTGAALTSSVDESAVLSNDVVHVGEQGSSAWFDNAFADTSSAKGDSNDDNVEIMEQVNDIVKTHNLGLVSSAVEQAAQEEMNEVDSLLDSIEEVLNVPIAADAAFSKKSKTAQLSSSSATPIQLSLALKKKK